MKNFICLFFFLSLNMGLNSCSYFQGKFRDTKSAISSKIQDVAELAKHMDHSMSEQEMKDQTLIHQKVAGYYILADGTYSNSETYVVPRLKILFLKSLIDELRHEGGGYLWLSYIDNDSKDNESLYLKVTVPLHTSSKPDFMTDGAVNYQKNRKNYELLHSKEVNDSLLEASDMKIREDKFLAGCNLLLSNRVYTKTYRNMHTDVIGSVQSAIKILSNAKNNNLIGDCILIGFSDFQDTKTDQKLNPDPSIKIFNLISQPGKSKNCIPESQEVTDTDYLLSILKL